MSGSSALSDTTRMRKVPAASSLPTGRARNEARAARAPEPPSREARPTVTGKANGALTGDIRNQVDRVWDAFWSGGIANPLEVVEQITYLLFLRRLDDLQ